MSDKLICSIDVGLVKCGYCIIGRDKKIHELKTVNLKPVVDDDKKQTLTEYQCGIITNLNNFIIDLNTRFPLDLFVIEQQIGKYSAKQIEMCLMQSIMHNAKDAKIDTLTPKCKLTVKYTEFEPKTETKKYNQNKNQSVENARAFLQQTNQDFKADRDMSDALLQAIYYIDKRLS